MAYKSCYPGKQVAAGWMAVVGFRGSKMGGRTMSGLLSGVAVVLLVLLQSTQSVYIQVSPSSQNGLLLKVLMVGGWDGEGMLGIHGV